THLYQFQILPFQLRVFVAQLPETDDLTCFQRGGIAWIGNDLLVVDPVVLLHEVQLADRFLFEETGVSRIVNGDLLHHLVNNHFKVLVVDLHALQTIYFLNFVHQVLLYRSRTLDRQNIGGRDGPVRQGGPGLDKVVVLNQDMLGQGNQVFLGLSVLGFNDDLPVAPFGSTQRHDPVDFRHHGRVGWIPCLEQLGNARQTTRDVAGLAGGTGDLHQYLTGFDLFPIAHDNVRSHGNIIGLLFPVLTNHGNYRVLGFIPGVDDHFLAVSCLFIRLFAVGNPFQNRFEYDLSCKVRYHYGVIRVPATD